MSTQTTPSLSITWQQPTFLLPLFCLCPLLAASNSLAMAIALSAVMMIITTSTTLLVHISQLLLPRLVHTMTWLILSGTIMAVSELLLHAWNYELYRALGLFLPMMVVACLLICRPEMESTSTWLQRLRDALSINVGFSFAAVILGIGREVIGHGSLFHDAELIFGPSAKTLSVTFFPADMGFLLGVLAPGAFIGFGIGVALYNWAWLYLRPKTPNHAQK